jgi:hypothetical protein
VSIKKINRRIKKKKIDAQFENPKMQHNIIEKGQEHMRQHASFHLFLKNAKKDT